MIRTEPRKTEANEGTYKSNMNQHPHNSKTRKVDVYEYVEQLEKNVLSLEEQNAGHVKRVQSLEEQNAALEKRLDKLKKLLPAEVEKSEHFQITDDEFSSFNISRKLHTMYNQDWAFLCRTLRKELPDIEELTRIQLMSKLMKDCYEGCKSFAETQLREFLLLDKTEDLPSQEEFQVFMHASRKFYKKESVIKKVTKKVLEEVYKKEEANDLLKPKNISKVRDQLDNFYGKFTETCWLVVISHPPIILNFEVVGKSLDEELKEDWTEYSTKKAVEDAALEEGTVKVVVWPKVELKGGYCYNKGDVLVVKKGKTVEKDSINSDADKTQRDSSSKEEE